MTSVFLVSGISYTSPSDWDNASNTVGTVGAGGGGARYSLGTSSEPNATGGGGGAYNGISNFTFAVPGTTTADYQIGTGGPTTGASSSAVPTAGSDGTATFFDGANLAASSVGSDFGRGGTTGTSGTVSGGAGGVAASGVGAGNDGGRGGNLTSVSANEYGATGGGGAAGPDGAGVAGTDAANPVNVATDGGAGDAGTGGAGGAGDSQATNAANGGVGGDGNHWDATHGPGGGGGGASCNGANASVGGAGGHYGAGGGGSRAINGQNSTGAAGYQGLIVLVYTPVGSVIRVSWKQIVANSSLAVFTAARSAAPLFTAERFLPQAWRATAATAVVPRTVAAETVPLHRAIETFYPFYHPPVVGKSVLALRTVAGEAAQLHRFVEVFSPQACYSAAQTAIAPLSQSAILPQPQRFVELFYPFFYPPVQAATAIAPQTAAGEAIQIHRFIETFFPVAWNSAASTAIAPSSVVQGTPPAQPPFLFIEQAQSWSTAPSSVLSPFTAGQTFQVQHFIERATPATRRRLYTKQGGYSAIWNGTGTV